MAYNCVMSNSYLSVLTIIGLFLSFNAILWAYSVWIERRREAVFGSVGRRYSLEYLPIKYSGWRFVLPYEKIPVRRLSGDWNGKSILIEDFFNSGSFFPNLYGLRNLLLLFPAHSIETRICIRSAQESNVKSVEQIIARGATLNEIESWVV